MKPNALQPGLVSVTFRALPAERIIELAREAQLQAIEWGGDVHVPHGDLTRAREVGRMTRDAGIEVVSYGSYYRAGVQSTRSFSREARPARSANEALLESPAFEMVLETARELGAPTIRVWAGNKGSQESSDADRARVIEDLHRITAMACQAGLSVALEYHQNTLTDTIESAGALLDAVPEPNLQTLWQPPHEDSLEHCLASLRAVMDRLGNVHVFHWKPSPRQRLPLSEGAERWSAYIEVLHQSAAQRYLLLEFVKDDSPDQFLADAQALRAWIEQSPADCADSEE